MREALRSHISVKKDKMAASPQRESEHEIYMCKLEAIKDLRSVKLNILYYLN